MTLKVGWCDFKAAKYACENFHYSRSVPAGKLVKIGVWEDDVFIGVVIFGRGANKSLGSPYGLSQTECCELVRVALTKHQSFVSEILSKAIKLLRKSSPGIRLIVSYADIEKRHTGIIYQSTNWIYSGKTHGEHVFVVHGKEIHAKSIHSRYGTGSQRLPWLHKHVDPKASVFISKGKHRYLMPLDKKMRKQILHLSKPYPK